MRELNKVLKTIENEIDKKEEEKKAKEEIISENNLKVENLNKESAECKADIEKIDLDIATLKKKAEETKALKKSLEEVSPIFNHEEEEEVVEEEEEEIVPEVEEEEVKEEVVEPTTEVEEVVAPVEEEEEVVEEPVEEPVKEEKTEVVEPEYDATLQEMVDQTNTTDKDLFEPNEYTEYTEPVLEPTLLENEKYNTKAPEVEFEATQEVVEPKVDLPVIDEPKVEEPIVEPKADTEETANVLDMINGMNPQDTVIEPNLAGYDTTSYQEMYDVKAPNNIYNPREEGVGIDDNRLMM